MLYLYVCWHFFQLMRYCYRCVWIDQLISVTCRLTWRWLYLVKNSCFYLSSLKDQWFLLPAPLSSSSSSCCAASTDISDPLSPLLPIIHRLRQVFRTTSRILTKLLYVCSSWSSSFCSAICGGPLEYITYELVPASPAVSCVSDSSNLDSFRDGRQVAV